MKKVNNYKKPTTMRLSEEAKHLLMLLSQKFGICQTSIIEMAVRKFAEIEELRWNDDNNSR